MNKQNPFSPPQARVDDVIATPSGALSYAGFWRRFGAYFIDFAVLLPIVGLSLWLGDKFRLFHLYYFVPGLIIGIFFHVWLVKQYGGTPGKLVLKIKIVRCDGSAVGYREAIIRHSVLFVLTTLVSLAIIMATLNISDAEYFSLTFMNRNVKLISLTPAWYQPVNILMNTWVWSEFIVMFTNKQRRAIHDYMAGTVVIIANTHRAEQSSSPSVPPHP